MDRHQGGAATGDPGSHLGQLGDQVFDLRLAGGIDYDRVAFGEDAGKQEILGGAHRWEGQLDFGSLQTAFDSPHQLAMDQLEVDAHRLEAIEMHVDGPGTEVVPAGEGDPRLTTTGEKGTEHHDRGPHLPNQLDRRLREELVGNNHPELVIALLHPAAGVLQHLAHQPDVEDRRDIGQTMPARSEQSRDHLLEHSVLGPQHADSPLETRSALDNQLGH